MCESLKTQPFVVNRYEKDKDSDKTTDTTVECWALPFEKYVKKQLLHGSSTTYQQFPVKDKLQFYTLLASFLNSEEGKHMIDWGLLGAKYMNVNPDYEKADKNKKPTDGINRFLPPSENPKTGEMIFPKISFVKVKVKAPLDSHDWPRSKKLPIFE